MNMSGLRSDPSRRYSQRRILGTLGAGAAATPGVGVGGRLGRAADAAPITRSDR